MTAWQFDLPGAIRCPCDAGWFTVETADQGFHCSSCGRWAAAAYLAELSSLQAQLARPLARRDWLWQQISEGTRGAAVPAPVPRASTGTRTLLLTLGAVLLSLAGIFFTAVAWSVLGPTARLVLLAGLGCLLGVAGWAANRRIPAAAEALTAVGAALIATAVYAAPALGAVGLAGSWLSWHSGASAVLMLVFGAALVTARMRAWAVASAAAGVAAAVISGIYVATVTDEPLAFTAITLVAGTVFAAGVLALGQLRPPWLAPIAGAVDLAWVIGALVVLSVGALSTWSWFGQTGRVVEYAGVLALFGAVGPLLRGVDPERVTRPVAEVTLGGFGGAATVVLLSALPDPSARLLSAVGLAGAVLVVWSLIGRGRYMLPYLLVVGSGALLLPPLGATGPAAGSGTAWDAGLGIAAAALAAAAWFGRAELRAGARTAWEALAWPAGVCAALAWFIFCLAEILEVYTVPAGIALVGAGLLWAHRRRVAGWPTPGSRAVFLPGLLMVVVPAGFVSLGVSYGDSEALIRSLVLLLGGAVLLSLGAWLRLGVLVVTGVVAVACATLGHLFAVGQVLPSWISFAAAGVLLLAVGARWEWLGNRGSRTRLWFGELR